jgi:diguanylate cyclase (GGDEF)-like protein
MVLQKQKLTLSGEIPSRSKGSQVRAVYLGSISVVILAFALFSADMWYEVKQDLDDHLNHTNKLFHQTTEAILIHHESMLRVLGRRLLEVDAVRYPERGRKLVNDLLELNPSMAGFGLARPDGQLVLVSGIQPGSPLPNLLQQKASAPGFQAALNSQEMVVGYTYFFPLLERWLVPTRISLRDNNNVVRLVMAAGIDIESAATLWNAIELDKDMRLTLMRDDGYVQLLMPSLEDEREEIYQRQNTISPVNTASDDVSRDPLVDATFAVSTPIKRYGLTLYSSYPTLRIYTEFGYRMIWPGLIFLVALLVSWVLYRYTLRRQQAYEKHLLYHAHHDALTHLPNRFLLSDRLSLDLARSHRNRTLVAVIYLDLDQFKRVNDSYGHEMGDHLLKACARRLIKVMRDGDTVGRLGGDEFLLILPDLNDSADAQALAARVMEEFIEPFDCAGRKLFSTASMGIALFPHDGDNADLLLQNADTALYKAKDDGRNSFCFFQPSLNHATARRVAVETELRQALNRGELTLHYQPKSRLDSDVWLGAEALLRWYNPALGQVSPVEFIPIAEETGLINDIGWFVLTEALKTLQKILVYKPAFSMSVNVSVRQLQDHTFIDRLLRLIEESGIQPELIELEVTESILAEGLKQMELLRNAGLGLAVDDFGTGFSSLSYLKHLPVTTLKIDREFIRDLETDTAGSAFTEAIISLARALELVTIAEGVETQQQREILRQQNCTQMQGYLLSKPLPEEILLKQLSL